jgi:hypothetical protein
MKKKKGNIYIKRNKTGRRSIVYARPMVRGDAKGVNSIAIAGGLCTPIYWIASCSRATLVLVSRTDTNTIPQIGSNRPKIILLHVCVRDNTRACK